MLKRSLIVLHGLALLACWLSAIPLFIKVFISLLIAFSWQRIAHTKSHYQQVMHLQYSRDLAWQIAGQDLNYQMITLLPSTVVTRYLIVIHYLNAAQSRNSLVVMTDSLASDDYRQLLVKLKVSGIQYVG